MELNEIAGEIIRKLTVEYYELRIQYNATTSISTERDKIKNTESNMLLSLELRVTSNKKTGYSKVIGAHPDKLIKSAISSLKLATPDENFLGICQDIKDVNIPDIYDKRIRDMTPEEMSEGLKVLIDSSQDNKIQLEEAGISAGYGRTLFINSEGVEKFEEATKIDVYSVVNNGLFNLWDTKSSRLLDIDYERIGTRLIELANKSMNPKKFNNGKYNVLLHPEAVNDIFSNLLFPNFLAENVEKQTSAFWDKKDSQVASDNLTLIDNARYPRGLASRKFDAEGTSSKVVPLIENGIIKGFLYDIYTARKENIESTGHATSLSIKPSIYPSNVIVKKGDLPLDKMVELTENGIYVILPMGGFTANPTSGDYSINIISGFRIENGEISSAIRHAMLVGNVFNLIKNIVEIGSDVEQREHTITPHILFSDQMIIF